LESLDKANRERPDVAQALRTGAFELVLWTDDLTRDHN
jgi:hypothetical protein